MISNRFEARIRFEVRIYQDDAGTWFAHLSVRERFADSAIFGPLRHVKQFDSKTHGGSFLDRAAEVRAFLSLGLSTEAEPELSRKVAARS